VIALKVGVLGSEVDYDDRQSHLFGTPQPLKRFLHAVGLRLHRIEQYASLFCLTKTPPLPSVLRAEFAVGAKLPFRLIVSNRVRGRKYLVTILSNRLQSCAGSAASSLTIV